MNNLEISNNLILTKLASGLPKQADVGRSLNRAGQAVGSFARDVGNTVGALPGAIANTAYNQYAKPMEGFVEGLSGAADMREQAAVRQRQLQRQAEGLARREASVNQQRAADAKLQAPISDRVIAKQTGAGNPTLARLAELNAQADKTRSSNMLGMMGGDMAALQANADAVRAADNALPIMQGASTQRGIEAAPGSLLARIGAKSAENTAAAKRAEQDAGERAGRANLMGARTEQDINMEGAPGRLRQRIGEQSAANTKAYAANQAEHGGDFVSDIRNRQQAQGARLAEEAQRTVENTPGDYFKQVGTQSGKHDIAAREAARNKAAQDNNETTNKQLAGEEARSKGDADAAEVARWKGLPVGAKIQEVAANMGKPIDQYTGGYGTEAIGGATGGLAGAGLARAMGAKGLGTTVGGLAGAGLGAGVAHGLKTGKLQEMIAKLTAGNKPTA